MVGTPLLDVLRGLILEPGEQAQFAADPSGYLQRYGYEEVQEEDLAEAIGLVADTLPADVARTVSDAVAYDEAGSPDDPTVDLLERISGAGIEGPDVVVDGGDPSGFDDPADGDGLDDDLTFGDSDLDGEAVDDATDGGEDGDDDLTDDDVGDDGAEGLDDRLPADGDAPDVDDVDDFGTGSTPAVDVDDPAGDAGDISDGLDDLLSDDGYGTVQEADVDVEADVDGLGDGELDVGDDPGVDDGLDLGGPDHGPGGELDDLDLGSF